MASVPIRRALPLELLKNPIIEKPMKKTTILYKVYDLYADGFRRMTVGKTLWLIILVKLFVIFVVLKLLFFPDFLARKATDDAGKADYVAGQLCGTE